MVIAQPYHLSIWADSVDLTRWPVPRAPPASPEVLLSARERGGAWAGPPHRSLRRDDDRDGRDRRVGNLRHPGGRGAQRALPFADPRRLAPRRPRRAAGGADLRRARRGQAPRGRPVRLLARGVPSRRRVPLRLGAPARHPDRRDGRDRHRVRALLRRAPAASPRRERPGGARGGCADGDQLPRGARGQLGAERVDGAEDRRAGRADRVRPLPRRRRPT